VNSAIWANICTIYSPKCEFEQPYVPGNHTGPMMRELCVLRRADGITRERRDLTVYRVLVASPRQPAVLKS